MNSEQIAPCPMCGRTDTLFVEPDERGSGGQWVGPIHVGCCQNEGCGLILCREDKDEAIAAWNNRPAQAELVSALERIDKMMRELRAIKSRPIANSGFSTGPALHFDQARRIALDARREVRATLSKYRTDGGV